MTVVVIWAVLGEDGIRQDEKCHPGHVSTWNDCLLKTAQAEGNAERIVTYAHRLYFDHYDVEGDFYAILKAHVPHEQWYEFAMQLAEESLNRKKGELYAEICVKENWHQQLMDYVKQVLDIRCCGNMKTCYLCIIGRRSLNVTFVTYGMRWRNSVVVALIGRFVVIYATFTNLARDNE